VTEVTIYTDGACKGNHGPGGWAAILECRGVEKVLSGGDPACTYNKMELTAVVTALEALTKPCIVTVYSDSKYIVDAINRRWLFNWPKRGWRNSLNEPTPNRELWERMLEQLKRHRVTFHWVKGHAGNPKNGRCDQIAVAEIQKYL
jgi:ribonuclease HI